MPDSATPVISISPPLTLEEMKSFGDFRTVYCVPAKGGGAGSLAPREGMNYRPRFIQEHLQGVVDHFPAHEFAGYVECRNMSEDNPPVARYYVRGRRVEMVTPTLVWPGEGGSANELVEDARAVALACKSILNQMPVMLSDFFEDDWGSMPDWFTGENNGREVWGEN